MLLDLLGEPYEVRDVPYSDRSELARLTGGYVYVPVLVDDAGKVTVESRRICELLLAGESGRRLVPAPLGGPIWGYSDFCDGPLEDILFRLATPLVRGAWQSPGDRALYTLIKERKFGAGCIDQWQAAQGELLERGRHLLAATLTTLEAVPFVFGEAPTLADAALYGYLAMLHEADPGLVTRLATPLRAYMTRLEAAASSGSAAQRSR
jgi:glutathione S-transferase